MKQGYRQLISAGMIVVATAVVISLCRAQDAGDTVSPPLSDAEAAQSSALSDGGASPQIVLADLKVYSVTAPSSATRGALISVGDVITNVGGVNIAQSVTDIYICPDVDNVSSSCWVTNHIEPGIAKNKSATWFASVTVPPSQTLGTNYYIVVANGNRQALESSYKNNTNYVMIIIDP